MKYNKPIITIDNGLAEGIYAASGASVEEPKSEIKISEPIIIADWGNSGQAKFTLDFSQLNLSQLTVTLTFNMDITSGWGSSSDAKLNGNILTLYWYSAPSTAEITVQANGNISQLKCTGSNASNAAA